MGKKLDSILEKVKSTYKVAVTDANEIGVIERAPLDSCGLNYAFGGGMPLGRMLFIHGPASGGKSVLSCYLAMQVQKKMNKAVLYLDYEYTFSAEYASQMGLDLSPEKFILIRPSNGEDGFNLIRDLVETGEVGFVVIDSISAMSSKSACDDAFSGFAGGKNAIMISNGLRMIMPYLYNNKCTMIVLSQERASMSMYGAEYKATGGNSPNFYSSWTARVTRTEDILDTDKSLIGICMKVRNTKNKVGIAKREANLKLYFNSGINSEDEYIDYLKSLHLLEQKGAYYSNAEWVADDGTVGMKVCGLEAVKNWLLENPKMYEKVKQQVNDIIIGHTNLDAENNDDDNEITTLEDGTKINADGEIVE